MLTTKNETSQAWPTIATSASAKTIETMASRIGSSDATTAPKTTSSTISAAGSPKKSSPSFRSLFERSRKSLSAVNSPVIETSYGPRSACWTTLDHVLDPVLGVGAHRDREHGRVLVRRDEALVVRAVIGRDLGRSPGRLQRRRQPLDLAAHLGFDVTSLPGARKRTTSLTKSSDRGRRVNIASYPCSDSGSFVTVASVVIADGSSSAIAATESTKIAPQIASIRFGCSAACRASLSVMPRG